MKHLIPLSPFVLGLFLCACSHSGTKTPSIATAQHPSKLENKSDQSPKKVTVQKTEEQETGTPTLQSATVVTSRIPGLPDSGIAVQNSGPSGKKTEGANEIKTVDLFRTKLSTPSEDFTVDADSDIEILGKQGTRVYIPAHSLSTVDSQLVHGKVSIQLLECYDRVSFFAHRLNTHTVSDELLETGGMIRVIAIQNGDTLETAPFKEMSVFFPKKGSNKPGMQPFLGVIDGNGGMDWKTDPSTSSSFSMGGISNDRLPVLGTKGYIETEITYGMELLPSNVEAGELPIDWKLMDSVGTLDSWMAGQEKRDDRRLKLIPRGPEGVRVNLTFTNDGEVETVTSTRLVDQSILDALYSILRDAPRIDMADKQPNTKCSVRFKGSEFIDRTAGQRTFEKKYNDFTKGIIDKIPNAELNYYIMSVSELGWINCDRFSRDSREKIAFTVQGKKDTEVFVVFTNINAQMGQVINEGATTFYNLPLGESVKVITLAQEPDGLKLSVSRAVVGRSFFNPKAGSVASLEEVRLAFGK